MRDFPIVYLESQDEYSWKHTEGAKPLHRVRGGAIPPGTLVFVDNESDLPQGQALDLLSSQQEAAICTQGSINGTNKPLVVRVIFVITIGIPEGT